MISLLMDKRAGTGVSLEDPNVPLGKFTLLEVLVAMAIFAIIGLGANEMLRSIIRTHDRVRQVTDTLGQLSMALVVIQRDVAEIVPRGIRDENGDPQPPLMVGTGTYSMEFKSLGCGTQKIVNLIVFEGKTNKLDFNMSC